MNRYKNCTTVTYFTLYSRMQRLEKRQRMLEKRVLFALFSFILLASVAAVRLFLLLWQPASATCQVGGTTAISTLPKCKSNTNQSRIHIEH